MSALGQWKYIAPFQAKCPWRFSSLITYCSQCPAEGAAFPYVIICAGRSCFCWYATQGFLQAAKHFVNTKAIGFFFLLAISQWTRAPFSARGLVRETARQAIVAGCRVSFKAWWASLGLSCSCASHSRVGQKKGRLFALTHGWAPKSLMPALADSED